MRPCGWLGLATALCLPAVMPASDFNTYIGDSSDYRVARVVADASGNTYVAGTRDNAMFVMKLDGTGKITLFATLNGKGSDQVNDLAVDRAGNLYLAGATNSTLLPLRNPLQTMPGGGFVVKFNPDATQVLYSTYFPDAIKALTLDASGNIYVTGYTYSSDFPVTEGLPAGTVRLGSLNATSAAFLTKISAAGDRIVYSMRISGHQKNCGAGSNCSLSSRSTLGSAVAVDAAGNAYLAGNTDTADLPTTAGALLGQGTGAFVAKVNAAGTALAYLTFLGPGYFPASPFTNPANSATGIAADAAGNAYVTGYTRDVAFPATAGAYQATLEGGTDAFVAKLNPQGSAVVWATYLGGKGDDAANSIALDAAGNVWVNGTTAGGDLLAELNATGTALSFTTRLPNDTAAASLAVDTGGTVHLAGYGGLVSTLTLGQNAAPRIFGIASAAYGPAGGRVAPGEAISIYGMRLGPSTPATGVPDPGGMMPTSLGGVQVSINGAAVPLLYVSETQVNAITPVYGLSGATATMRISFNGMDTANFVVTLATAIPEIFQGADGTAAAVNQDGSINSPEHAAPAGSVVSLWATGVASQPFGIWQDGRIATLASDFGCCQIWAGGPANVLYAGSAPGLVAGVAQVNFQVPVQRAYYGNTLGVSLTAAGATSHSVRIYLVTPND